MRFSKRLNTLALCIATVLLVQEFKIKGMATPILTPQEYIDSLPEERKKAISEIRIALLTHLPKGFEETINDGMIGYVVPHALYPAGYHVNPQLPLPFINLANQKNYIALYHMGLYADKPMLDWFVQEYSKQQSGKLDMGKSCIRFKKWDQLPLALIGQLATKYSPKQWIALYEKMLQR